MDSKIDQNLRTNDSGISTIKTVCNVLDVNISRDIIEDHILVEQEGSSLGSLNKFLEEFGFKTQYKLFDFKSIKNNQAEIQEFLPFIVQIKNKKGIKFVVIDEIQGDRFSVLDPTKKQPYFVDLEEFKKMAYYSSTNFDFVEVEEFMKIQIEQSLERYQVRLDIEPTNRQLTEIFNKLIYFSYIDKNYGFKNGGSAREFLYDLIHNQELAQVPKRFHDIVYEDNSVKIKAPTFLSVKKTTTTKTVEGTKHKNVYWRLFKTVASIKGLWYIFLSTAVIASIISYISVFVNQILIDHVLPSYELNTLRIFAIGVGAFYIVDSAFSIYKKFVSIHLSNAFDRHFVSVLDLRLSTYSVRYLQTYKKGDLTERLKDTMKLKSFFTKYFASIIVDVMIGTSSLVLLFLINWKLSFIVMFVLLLYVALFIIITPIIEDLERMRYSAKAEFMSRFIEKIEGIQSIKALSLENYTSERVNQGMEELIRIRTRSKYVGMFNSVATSIIKTFATLTLLVLTSREMILYNTMSLGMIITYLALSKKIFSAFNNLLDKNLSIQENKVILQRFFDFDENKSNTDKKAKKSKRSELPMSSNVPGHSGFKKKSLISDFKFESMLIDQMSFTYDNTGKVLDNINLEINKNDKICIHGRNGSGKSTLCKILGMLYKQTDGSIYINGLDNAMYDRKKLRSKILFVTGNDILFHETLLFNVAFGRKTDLNKLVRYSKQLGLYDFIQTKADKFEFMIYENGRNLSTGQRKKVLLLRALMSKAEVIILDEIFNGLDKESKAMAEDLIQSINDRTFILISHMPMKNIQFDQIYDIKNGKLLKHAA